MAVLIEEESNIYVWIQSAMSQIPACNVITNLIVCSLFITMIYWLNGAITLPSASLNQHNANESDDLSNSGEESQSSKEGKSKKKRKSKSALTHELKPVRKYPGSIENIKDASIAKRQMNPDGISNLDGTEPEKIFLHHLVEKTRGNGHDAGYEFVDKIPENFMQPPHFGVTQYIEGIRIHATESHISYYDHKAKTPLLVYQKVSSSEFTGENVGVRPNFYTHGLFPHMEDYKYQHDNKNPKINRGHACPAGNVLTHQAKKRTTFLPTNIAAQYPKANEGLICDIELVARTIAFKAGETHEFTGFVYSEDSKVFGNHKIVVADKWYKIIVIENGESAPQLICFMMDHTECPEGTPSQYLTTLSEIEKASGLKFFPGMPKKHRQRMARSEEYKWIVDLPAKLCRDIIRYKVYKLEKSIITDKIRKLYDFNNVHDFTGDQHSVFMNEFNFDRVPTFKRCEELAKQIGLKRVAKEIQRWFIVVRNWSEKQRTEHFMSIEIGASNQFDVSTDASVQKKDRKNAVEAAPKTEFASKSAKPQWRSSTNSNYPTVFNNRNVTPYFRQYNKHHPINATMPINVIC